MQTNHKINLLKTAIALLAAPQHELRMEQYVTDDTGGEFPDISAISPKRLSPANLPRINTCGTSTCFAGFGPLAGIAAEEDEDGVSETWIEYVFRVYGFTLNCDAWDFFFSGAHPNDKILCGLRTLGFMRGCAEATKVLDDLSVSVIEEEAIARIDYDAMTAELGVTRDEELLLSALNDELNLLQNADTP